MKPIALLSTAALLLGAASAALAADPAPGAAPPGNAPPAQGGVTEPPGKAPAAGGAIENNPSTARPRAPHAAGPVNTTTEATAALRARGYSEVEGLTRTGDTYRARALRDGRQVQVEIDAKTGAIRNIGG